MKVNKRILKLAENEIKYHKSKYIDADELGLKKTRNFHGSEIKKYCKIINLLNK